MEIEFLGAAQTVTGSMHLVHTDGGTVLLDCGLFQGRRGESRRRNENLPFRARNIVACVLSHAHIDHSGLLPMLFKNGFRGTIHCTPATRDLCAAMLEDAAMIQFHDARYLNEKFEREGLDVDPIEPLYSIDDVAGTLGLMSTVPYRRPAPVAPGVELTFYDAGHVLGSAVVALDVDVVGETRRVVFTGDLGRRGMPFLRDPEVPDGAHFLICESTYGNRMHDPIERTDDDLEKILEDTFERGGRVVIPSFALERAQEIIFALKRLRGAGRMREVPVYVDSPLTVRVTDIFRMHPECYDVETRALVVGDDSPFYFDGLHYTHSVDDSKRITASKDPCVVISASGMCESGRILHHLKATVGDPSNTVIIVGWQAPHTLGRRLVEGRMRVPIFGVERERRAQVHVLNGFSAHADRDDLIDFCEQVRERGPLRRVALVHGEPPAQKALAAALGERGFPEVLVPSFKDRITS